MNSSEGSLESKAIKGESNQRRSLELSQSSFPDRHHSDSIQQSMVITLLPNMELQSRQSLSMQEEPFQDKDEENEDKQIEDKQLCIEPLCFERTRMIDSEKSHKDHHKIFLKGLLKDLTVLKSNSYFKRYNSERVQKILANLNHVVQEIFAFQNEFLSTIRDLKLKTIKHINDVKQSFELDHYQQLRRSVLEDFSYSTVTYALGEIEKYRKIRYDNLDYPQFKSTMVMDRIKEINFNHKVLCLEQLKEWIKYLEGDHSNQGKVYNRSTSTFMYKSPSEMKIFSYYLKSPDYLVIDHGRKLQRIDLSQELPLAFIQKRLDEAGVKIKVNKIGPKGISIGCGVLTEIQKKKFDNSYNLGFFLHNTGVLFSAKVQNSDTFRFCAGDIISLHRNQHQIQFFKKQGDDWKGFHRNLHAFSNSDKLNVSEQFYAAVFLGDKESEVSIVSD